MTNRVYRSSHSLLSQILSTDVPTDALAIWHLGQAGVMMKGAGIICCFDPYLTNAIDEQDPQGPWKRSFVPPLIPGEAACTDYVFITHHHMDHLDPATLQPMNEANPGIRYIVPAPFTGILTALGIQETQIVPARVGERITLSPNLRFTAIACKHEDYYLDDYGDHGYLGYVVELNGIHFYHAGDTIGFQGLIDSLKPLQIDIACLPINSRDWKRAEMGILGNLGHRDAVDLAVAVDADLVIPIHYDLFPFNADNPSYFIDYLYQTAPGLKHKMMVPGERFVYLKEVRE